MTTPVGEPHFFVTRSWRDLAEGRLPDRHLLDRASREHPVMIQAWAPVTPNAMAFNSLALARLGLDARTPERIGEVWIEKDARGAPTGIVTGSVTNYYSSDSFNHSLWRQIPFVQLDKAFAAVERGHAPIQRPRGHDHLREPRDGAAHIDCYRALRLADALTLRVAVAQEAESYGLPWSRPKTVDEFTRGCEQAAESIETHDELFRFLGMTLMRDGSCWPGTIRMREPYFGPYGQPTEGVEYISRQRAALTMDVCGSCGMRLNTVVMGTRAHEDNLEQLEAAARVFDVPSLHWLLVHAWFLEPEQTRRYAQLGMNVTTSMAFTWGKGKPFRSRMKPSVLADLVPLRRILDSGLVVAGGSDWGPKCAFKQIEPALTHEVARDAVEGHGHEVVDAFQVDGAARAALEHADRADVHVRAAVLDAEEGRVEGGESFVVSVSWHLCTLCRSRRAGVRDHVTQAIGALGRTAMTPLLPRAGGMPTDRCRPLGRPSQACFAGGRKLLPLRTSGAYPVSEPWPAGHCILVCFLREPAAG
jgi:predicted amidohydrolase YtcJ